LIGLISNQLPQRQASSSAGGGKPGDKARSSWCCADLRGLVADHARVVTLPSSSLNLAHQRDCLPSVLFSKLFVCQTLCHQRLYLPKALFAKRHEGAGFSALEELDFSALEELDFSALEELDFSAADNPVVCL
jgi:hypothetical protein